MYARNGIQYRSSCSRTDDSTYGRSVKVLQVPPYVRRPMKPDCPKGAEVSHGPGGRRHPSSFLRADLG
jgi:hypothetical protein